MAIPRRVKEYLSYNNVSYSHKTRPVAEVAQIPGSEFVKTVVLRADERMILAVLPEDYVINFEILEKQAGCGKLALASEKEFIEEFSDCQPGAMPPFGRLFGLPLYCESTLAKQAEMEFKAGTHVDTVRITFASFVKLEYPIMLRFSEKHDST